MRVDPAADLVELLARIARARPAPGRVDGAAEGDDDPPRAGGIEERVAGRDANVGGLEWNGGPGQIDVVIDELAPLPEEVARAVPVRNRPGLHRRVGYAFDAPLATANESAPRTARWLVVRERRIPLVAGENLIGRDEQASVWLDHATVSRRHARLTVSEAGAVLEDLQSKNGTRLGKTPLAAEAILRDGDRLGFGEISAVYRESSSGLPTETQVSRIDRAAPNE